MTYEQKRKFRKAAAWGIILGVILFISEKIIVNVEYPKNLYILLLAIGVICFSALIAWAVKEIIES